VTLVANAQAAMTAVALITPFNAESDPGHRWHIHARNAHAERAADTIMVTILTNRR
jgi:hypothetical protein